MVIENDSNNVHWIEKYRPKQLDELISHQDIIQTIDKFIAEDRLPHMLFYGPPGTGKTSTILACARKLFSEKEMPSMVLELNASDDRGIGIVRGPIQSFASTKVIFNKKAFKLIILDESDAMTKDAQNALRRIIEKYTLNVRFCFICNYLNKIIPAIQSRCTKFRFAPLKSAQIDNRVNYIINNETLNVTEDGKEALIELSGGDMRKVLNVLQATSNAFGMVNQDNVYKCCGLPSKTHIQTICDWLLYDKFATIYQNILTMQAENGYALGDILTQVHPMMLQIELPSSVKLDILAKLADLQFQLSAGGSEKMQLPSFIAIFQGARNLAAK